MKEILDGKEIAVNADFMRIEKQAMPATAGEVWRTTLSHTSNWKKGVYSNALYVEAVHF